MRKFFLGCIFVFGALSASDDFVDTDNLLLQRSESVGTQTNETTEMGVQTDLSLGNGSELQGSLILQTLGSSDGHAVSQLETGDIFYGDLFFTGSMGHELDSKSKEELEYLERLVEKIAEAYLLKKDRKRKNYFTKRHIFFACAVTVVVGILGYIGYEQGAAFVHMLMQKSNTNEEGVTALQNKLNVITQDLDRLKGESPSLRGYIQLTFGQHDEHHNAHRQYATQLQSNLREARQQLVTVECQLQELRSSHSALDAACKRQIKEIIMRIEVCKIDSEKQKKLNAWSEEMRRILGTGT